MYIFPSQALPYPDSAAILVDMEDSKAKSVGKFALSAIRFTCNVILACSFSLAVYIVGKSMAPGAPESIQHLAFGAWLYTAAGVFYMVALLFIRAETLRYRCDNLSAQLEDRPKSWEMQAKLASTEAQLYVKLAKAQGQTAHLLQRVEQLEARQSGDVRFGLPDNETPQG